MKNILKAAALVLLTILVVLAAAYSNSRVQDKCIKEWESIPCAPPSH